jgi:hypothetical protein
MLDYARHAPMHYAAPSVVAKAALLPPREAFELSFLFEADGEGQDYTYKLTKSGPGCALLQQPADNELSRKVKAEDGGNDHALAMHRVENAVIEGPQNQAAKSGAIERAGSWNWASWVSPARTALSNACPRPGAKS